MNSDFASAWGSAKRAPRPFASRYRPVGAARAADPVRIGEREQHAGPLVRVGRSRRRAAPNSRCQLGRVARRLSAARAHRRVTRRAVPRRSPRSAPTRRRRSTSRAPGSRAQHVAFAQDRRQVARQARRPQVARLDQHVREARMRAERRQSRGHARVMRAGVVDGFEPRAAGRAPGRAAPPGGGSSQRSRGASDGAPTGELQRERREIGMQDFRRRFALPARRACPRTTAGSRRPRSSGRRGRGADPPRPATPFRSPGGSCRWPDRIPHSGAIPESTTTRMPSMVRLVSAMRGRQHDLAPARRRRARAPRPARRRRARRTAAAPVPPDPAPTRSSARCTRPISRGARQKAQHVAVMPLECAAQHLRRLQLERDLRAARDVMRRHLDSSSLRA